MLANLVISSFLSRTCPFMESIQTAFFYSSYCKIYKSVASASRTVALQLMVGKKMDEPISLAVCSLPKNQNEYSEFISRLQVHENVSVTYVCLSSNAQRENDALCQYDAVILIHSIDRGRLSITDVQDAQYNELLPRFSEEFGPFRIAVLVHGLSDPEASMEIFAKKQPTTMKCSHWVKLCKTLLDEDVISTMTTFLAKVHECPKPAAAVSRTVPSKPEVHLEDTQRPLSQILVEDSQKSASLSQAVPAKPEAYLEDSQRPSSQILAKDSQKSVSLSQAVSTKPEAHLGDTPKPSSQILANMAKEYDISKSASVSQAVPTKPEAYLEDTQRLYQVEQITAAEATYNGDRWGLDIPDIDFIMCAEGCTRDSLLQTLKTEAMQDMINCSIFEQRPEGWRQISANDKPKTKPSNSDSTASSASMRSAVFIFRGKIPSEFNDDSLMELEAIVNDQGQHEPTLVDVKGAPDGVCLNEILDLSLCCTDGGVHIVSVLPRLQGQGQSSERQHTADMLSLKDSMEKQFKEEVARKEKLRSGLRELEEEMSDYNNQIRELKRDIKQHEQESCVLASVTEEHRKRLQGIKQEMLEATKKYEKNKATYQECLEQKKIEIETVDKKMLSQKECLSQIEGKYESESKKLEEEKKNWEEKCKALRSKYDLLHANVRGEEMKLENIRKHHRTRSSEPIPTQTDLTMEQIDQLENGTALCASQESDSSSERFVDARAKNFTMEMEESAPESGMRDGGPVPCHHQDYDALNKPSINTADKDIRVEIEESTPESSMRDGGPELSHHQENAASNEHSVDTRNKDFRVEIEESVPESASMRDNGTALCYHQDTDASYEPSVDTRGKDFTMEMEESASESGVRDGGLAPTHHHDNDASNKPSVDAADKDIRVEIEESAEQASNIRNNTTNTGKSMRCCILL